MSEYDLIRFINELAMLNKTLRKSVAEFKKQESYLSPEALTFLKQFVVAVKVLEEVTLDVVSMKVGKEKLKEIKSIIEDIKRELKESLVKTMVGS